MLVTPAPEDPKPSSGFHSYLNSHKHTPNIVPRRHINVKDFKNTTERFNLAEFVRTCYSAKASEYALCWLV